MRRSILLVEDQAPLALDEARLIQKHGFEVITAFSPEQALESVKNNREIALVLMDIDLGKGGSGTELAEQILAYRELPIVFLSNNAEREMVEKVRNITRYGYVLKNSGEFVLIESIHMAFELFEAHKALEENRRFLSAVMQNLRIGVVACDRHGRLSFFNEKMSDLHKAPQKNIPPEMWAEQYNLYLADGRTKMQKEQIPLYRAWKGDFFNDVEMVIKNDAGETLTMLASGQPMKDEYGTIEGAVVSMYDITARRKAERMVEDREAKLFESRKKYSELFEYAPIIMWQEDFSGIKRELDKLRKSGVEDLSEYIEQNPDYLWQLVPLVAVTDINRATMDLLQLTTKEPALGSLSKTFTDASLDLFKNELLAVWNGRTVYEDTGTIRPPNGRERHIIIRFQVLPDFKDTMKEVILSFIDITDRLNAENRVKQLLLEKNMLLQEVHHRIKNDMNTISSLLSLQASSIADEQASEALEEARQRITLMREIYESLYQSEHYQQFSIKEYIETIIDNIRSTHDEFTDIQIETDLVELTVPTKKAFPLGIILNELVTNAYKYAFSTSRSGKIEVKMYNDEQHHTSIIVRDNGSGFPQDVIQKGTYGFGLTLVQTFVEQYKGELNLKNRKTGGAEIRAVLQVSE